MGDQARPLAVDHVLIAVADRAGAQRGQVRPCPGLGVPDREVDLARRDLRQVERLLLLGAEPHDRRPCQLPHDLPVGAAIAGSRRLRPGRPGARASSGRRSTRAARSGAGAVREGRSVRGGAGGAGGPGRAARAGALGPPGRPQAPPGAGSGLEAYPELKLTSQGGRCTLPGSAPWRAGRCASGDTVAGVARRQSQPGRGVTVATGADAAVPRSIDLLTVGEIARRSGFAESAIRYYERLGLLAATRTSGGQRRFERSMLRRLAFIRAARNIGLSLDEVAATLRSLPAGRTPTRTDWARLSAGWRDRLDGQIAALVALRDGLDSCIGCGCLSLDRCAISNPGDSARADGPGAAYLPPGLRRADPGR